MFTKIIKFNNNNNIDWTKLIPNLYDRSYKIINILTCSFSSNYYTSYYRFILYQKYI